ncbi:PAS domain S-box protein [Halovenus sp. WSH3]|uniref:histidine kinase n=1 Tax=Halovenus carboxidivorans TaxID=2692199 RepID=A0A6B0TCH0_9EURY|nr:PAS domain S-box protein [Halovenus carboxidivorans]MXR52931.1 PAS domain S-box protein [Halovenus carboxidivorans]
MGDGADPESVGTLPPGLDTFAEPVCLLNSRGEIRDCNDTFADLVDRTRSAVVGTAGSDLFAEPPDHLTEAIGQALDTGNATVETTTLAGEGTRLRWALSPLPEWWIEEPTVLCIGSHQRHLDRLQTERQDRYESLVQQSNDGIAVVQNHRLAFVNETFAEITGYEPEALVGKHFEDLCSAEYRDVVRQRYESRIDGESPPNQYELEIETREGDTRMLDLAVTRIEHEGEPATLVNVRDITERMRRQSAVERLQDATEQIQQAETAEEVAAVAVEAATDVFDLPFAICWFHDDDTNRLEPAYATEEAREEGFVDSFGPESYEYGVFRDGDPTSYTPRAVAPENSLTNAVLLPLGTHGMIGVGGREHVEFDDTVVDVTRTLAEHTTTALDRVDQTRELREERALTESIFVALPDVFYAFDEHGQFFRWNDRLSAVTGYSDEEIASMHPAELFPPEEREQIYEAIADVFEEDTTVTIEAHFQTKEGEQIPYEFTGARLTDETGESLGLVGIGRNISDRKQRQRRFEAVFNNTYQFTGLMEPDGTLIEVNEAALEFGDLDPEDVIGTKLWDAFWFKHSDALREETKAGVERAADGEFVRQEVSVQGSDREAIIDFSIRPVTDDHGEVTLLIPEGRDITELKERERELRRERDHIRRTEAQADVGGWEIDLDTENLYWTDGLRDLYDVGPSFEPRYEDAIGYFHPENRETVAEALQACRENGTEFDIEARIITAAGRTRWVRIEGERVTDADTRTLRGVVRDITERKEREQRLMVLNRVLRHNLRNKLTVVTGYADHVERSLETLDIDSSTDPAEARERLREFPLDEALTSVREIQASSDDLTELSQKVRTFGETIKRVDVTDSIAVRSVLRELQKQYTAEYPEADIEADLGEAQVQGNREFLTLVVGELLENALVHNDSETPTVALSVDTDAEERVTIRVVDNGPGIPDIEREVLREGEEDSLLHGSGIGLWTIHWLVTRVGGNVSIADNDPTGTVVEISIPRPE